jgi:hypothetical protein
MATKTNSLGEQKLDLTPPKYKCTCKTKLKAD